MWQKPPLISYSIVTSLTVHTALAPAPPSSYVPSVSIPSLAILATVQILVIQNVCFGQIIRNVSCHFCSPIKQHGQLYCDKTDCNFCRVKITHGCCVFFFHPVANLYSLAAGFDATEVEFALQIFVCLAKVILARDKLYFGATNVDLWLERPVMCRPLSTVKCVLTSVLT